MFSKHPTHISPSNCSSTNDPCARAGVAGAYSAPNRPIASVRAPAGAAPNKACQQGAIDTRLPLNKMIQMIQMNISHVEWITYRTFIVQ